MLRVQVSSCGRNAVEGRGLMDQCSNQPGGHHPSSGTPPASARWIGHWQVRLVLALIASSCATAHTAFAGDIPTASANAELVAFAGAEEYAESPQLQLSASVTGEAALRNRSLTYIAREFAHLIVRDIRKNMRDESPRRAPRIHSNYDLRVSDDKFVVRMKYRF